MFVSGSTLIRADQLTKELNVSRTTLWRWCNLGYFPPPFTLGSRITVWEVNEINQWLQSQKHS